MLSEKIKLAFDRTVDVVFGVILVLIIVSIAIGAAQLLLSAKQLLAFDGVTGHYIHVITDVLTLYVLIELSRSLVEYFQTHKLRLTFIADAAIVFVIRDVLILMFKHEIDAEMLYAYGFFLLVLGSLRIASVIVYQREKRITSD